MSGGGGHACGRGGGTSLAYGSGGGSVGMSYSPPGTREIRGMWDRTCEGGHNIMLKACKLLAVRAS